MMMTDKDDICFEWSQPHELIDPTESQMEDPHKTLQRESSISFGRFETDSLSWEKWSSFSQNRYLEEVERFSTPGSVIQKKAYFEAHFKKIAAKRALEQQAQLESQSGISSNYNEDGVIVSNYNEDGVVNHNYNEDGMVDHNNEDGMIDHNYNEDQYLEESPDPNDEDFTFSHSIDFDNSPHHTDTEEGNFIIINPKSGMSVGQTEEASQLPPAMNNFEQEHVYSEAISSSNNLVMENDKEHCRLVRDSEVDDFNMMDVDKTNLRKEEQEQRHSPESAHSDNKDAKEAEENEVASNHALMDSQKQEQKEKPTKKNTATSNGKRAKVPHNGTSISSKASSNGTSRTSKVRVSSGPSNSARGLPKVSAKPDSGVVITKEADVDATKRKKSVSLTASINSGTDKRASTRKVLGDKKQASKAELNSSTVTITSKKEASANGVPKTAGLRTPHKEQTRHQNDNLTAPKKKTEKKQPESKMGGDAARSTPAGSHKSPSANRLENKANGVIFSFKSDERAEKRKEFYMKLEEKMNAKEAEMNQIQAKTQEEMEAEIKQLRKRLTFKATPMPTFYQEASSTKSENKRVSQTSAKSQNPGKKSITSGTDSDSSTVPTHKISSMQGVKNNTSPSKKHTEAQPEISVTSHVNKAQKEGGSRNLSPGKPLKSKLPVNASPKKETVHPARQENSSAKVNSDGSKSRVTENLSTNEESNKKSAPITHEKTSVSISESSLDGRQEDSMNGNFDPSSEVHNVAQAKNEMNIDEAESKIIANTRVKDALQNTHNAKDSENGKEKLGAQKAEGVKDKDANITGGSVSRIKPKSPRNASLSIGHESKDKAIKAAKLDRQKIIMPVEKGKRESPTNASIKRGMKDNAGLACLIADVAVA
ncbi:hypothetical protein SUGI_0111030 [Cryptomeria japonica]|uniref:uncharacterized protein LOC131078825 n=1 Tax=Cryptomeria japonica TaxID=3369 RepID=UPI00240898DE|nr:uncharacterized protein LOC131078825 [Cryptomeria japonica]GLJ09520.1 hypothetical protein SUGI_0111030 [Cryptomeria japonica]